MLPLRVHFQTDLQEEKMRQEAFTEALAKMEPQELDAEKKAWAEYWHRKDAARKDWEEMVLLTKITSIFGVIAAPLIFLSSLMWSWSVDTLPFHLLIPYLFTHVFGFGSAVVGGFFLPILFLALIQHSSFKRAIPELPENYDERMGELAHGMREKISAQRRCLREVAKLQPRHEEIEADLAQLSAYQLAVQKDAAKLSEPEGFERLHLDAGEEPARPVRIPRSESGFKTFTTG